ncbi:MAG: hypothetical protein E7510_08480 [Ruminococcus sp.]|nr:hypothetical protein [Ruminococcus sp.]
MEITEMNQIKNYTSVNARSNAKSLKVANKASVKGDATEAENVASSKAQIQDSFTRQPNVETTDTGIYSKESISKALETAEEQRTQAFISMIEKMFEAQGNSSYLSVSDITEHIKSNFTQEDIEAAKQSVSEGGFYSVDAVATRITDMAMALAGDDPSKISVLRDAVTKGFGQAAETLRLKEDDMPDITKRTYTEIMKRFDEWEKSYETSETNVE